MIPMWYAAHDDGFCLDRDSLFCIQTLWGFGGHSCIVVPYLSHRLKTEPSRVHGLYRVVETRRCFHHINPSLASSGTQFSSNFGDSSRTPALGWMYYPLANIRPRIE